MNLEKHISNIEVLELTRKAFENNQVPELLCGEKGYSVGPLEGDWYAPSNIPTDIVAFWYFAAGIDLNMNKMFNIMHKAKRRNHFFSAIGNSLAI